MRQSVSLVQEERSLLTDRARGNIIICKEAKPAQMRSSKNINRVCVTRLAQQCQPNMSAENDCGYAHAAFHSCMM